MTKVDKLDKLKEYKVYLTDEEKRHLADVALKNSTFGESVLAGIVHQIFDAYEDDSLDNYDHDGSSKTKDSQKYKSDAGSLIF